MNTQCIVYITDKNYIFPTLVSAMQARRFCQDTTDVLVLLSEKISDFSALEADMGKHSVSLIDYYAVFNESLNKLDDSGFQGEISKTAMCRLLLHKTLPENYTQIIYLDGDTQVLNSLESLENYQVPPGRFLASSDYLSITDYLKGDVLPRHFNSGVLKLNRDGWIGQAAFDLYLEKKSLQFHDQEVLNVVGKDALILISNNWNYPKQFLSLLPEGVKPSIVHFMGHPKPWHGVFFPWSKSAYDCYTQARKNSPILNKYYKDISLVRKVVYRSRSIQQRFLQADVEIKKQRLSKLFIGEFEI
jgi:lipopolysaccharide biosynthesis glycosyltransferase